MAPKVVVIGSGWAGFYIAEKIDQDKYDFTIISPRRTSAYTPLLASAACGVFNFYLAEESVRSKYRKKQHFIKANVVDIDFDAKRCRCSPAFEEEEQIEALADFDVSYDILVIAPGCVPNTFGTPGVEEHALFVKNVSDAMKVRKVLFDLLEMASLPNTSVPRIKELLHIIIVGGGPTGIEMTAELDDLAHNELQDLYPEIAQHISISVHDVAPHILTAYDEKLYEYANNQLIRRHINVETNSHIESVSRGCMYTKEKGRIGCGMVVWATGNKNVPLVEKLDVEIPPKGLKRIITDSRLRVFKSKEDAIHENVFALGDAADITEYSLPTTAEVAVQKAKYLVDVLNSASPSPTSHPPFKYQDKPLVSYIGGRDGVIAGKGGDPNGGWTGRSAWLAWRGFNVTWNRSWRSRCMILFTWAMNAVFGKEVAKI